MNIFTTLPVIIALHGVITPQSADKLINEIEWATRPIVIDIDSGGGDMWAAELIVDAIEKSPQPIMCVVNNWAASAAAYILTACPSNQVSDDAEILYHLPFRQVKYTNIHAPAMSFEKRFLETMSTYNLRKQFTRAQWLQFISGGDVIIRGYEWELLGLEK